MSIAASRLRNQRLVGERLSEADEVVRWLGAVQAQDYHGAKWALALRGSGLTSARIDRAFDEGRILRTHVMRPTWHFVAPGDIRWLLALTAPRVHTANAHAYRTVDLDGPTFSRAHRVITRALTGGRARTRDDLAAVLNKGGVQAHGLRLACIVMHAELSGLICSGPLRGRRHTYMLLEERVPPARTLTRDEALATLARRYFVSHGPATVHDFSWWSGLTMADARAAVESVRVALEPVAIDGTTYWTGMPPLQRKAATLSVHLLPNYDEHVVAYRDHGHTLDPEWTALRDRVDGPLGVHLVARNGLVVGGWRRTLEKTRAAVATRLLLPLRPRDRRALEQAVVEYGRFLELPVTVSAS